MTEKMTLSEMFKSMSQLQSDCAKAEAIKVYRVSDDNLGDIKVLSAVAAREMDVYRLALIVMADRLYTKYRDLNVLVTSWDGNVFKVWIGTGECDD